MRRGLTLIEVVIVLAIVTVLMGSVGLALAEILEASDFARNLIIANFESQRAMTEICRTLTASSRRKDSPYRPRNHNGELAFRMVRDFNASEEKAVYADFFVCYYLDDDTNTLRRRFRIAAGSNPGGLITGPNPYHSAWQQIQQLFPGPADQEVGRFITEFSFSIDDDLGIVSVSIVSTVGSGQTQASVRKSASVRPFNAD
ncbi:MAG: hypothetical protein DRP82_04880 [Planctomycetota bacterium]|nr:MAG: hypothetical protein DRP82_04880 [Planctomycetota bacterium]